MKDENNSMWRAGEFDVKGQYHVKCKIKLHIFKNLQGHCGWNVVREGEREMRWDSKDSQGPDYAEVGGLYLETWVLFWVEWEAIREF